MSVCKSAFTFLVFANSFYDFYSFFISKIYFYHTNNSEPSWTKQSVLGCGTHWTTPSPKIEAYHCETNFKLAGLQILNGFEVLITATKS